MSGSPARFRWLLGRLGRSWIVLVAVGLAIGLLIAPVAFQVTTPSPGTVAVVPIEGGIDGETAAETEAKLQEAREDPSVEAVVLVSNSPGGSATASESLYMEVARTAEEMPVVASVGAMAASGAYYTIAPSDQIYAQPSSLVGSVGAFIERPQDPQPIDEVIATGPDKLSGGDERDWAYKTESLRLAFVGAVVESRGDALTLSEEEVGKAGMYTGAEAVQNGLVDDVGTTADAVAEAADRADLGADYEVETFRPDGPVQFISETNYVASDAPDKELVPPERFVGNLSEDPAVPQVVMLPGSVLAAAADNGTDDGASSNEPGSAGGDDPADGNETAPSIDAPAPTGIEVVGS